MANGDFEEAAKSFGKAVSLTESDPSVPFRHYAEAVGPGGAVVARAGEESEPLRALPEAAVEEPEEQPSRSRVGLWVGLGIGLAVVVAAGIVTAVLLTVDLAEPDTQLDPFVVSF